MSERSVEFLFLHCQLNLPLHFIAAAFCTESLNRKLKCPVTTAEQNKFGVVYISIVRLTSDILSTFFPALTKLTNPAPTSNFSIGQYYTVGTDSRQRNYHVVLNVIENNVKRCY